MTKNTPKWTVGVYVENDFEPAYFPVERDERDATGFVKSVRPLIAKVTYGETVEEKFANARLIAAAPDLLDALKLVSRWILEQPMNQAARDLRTEHRNKAIAAIAKAENENNCFATPENASRRTSSC